MKFTNKSPIIFPFHLILYFPYAIIVIVLEKHNKIIRGYPQ